MFACLLARVYAKMPCCTCNIAAMKMKTVCQYAFFSTKSDVACQYVVVVKDAYG